MNVLSPDTGSKKMNKNVLVVLGGAVLAAILVAMLVQVTLGGKKDAPKIASGVEVLVAAKELKVGSELGEGDMLWKEWPESALFRGAIIRKDGEEPYEALEGRLDRSFSKGEAMVRRGILKETSGNVVAARLQPGERAVSIDVDESDLVSGFVQPGNFVDVVFTYRAEIEFVEDEPKRPSNKEDPSPGQIATYENEKELFFKIHELQSRNFNRQATEIILQNVRVLAVNRVAVAESDEDEKSKKKARASKKNTVTLALKVEDTEKLVLASSLGEVTLALRGVGDDQILSGRISTTDSRLVKIDDELFEEYNALKEAPDVIDYSDVVKIYKGDDVQEFKVK